MKAARLIFLFAGIYGLIVLTPLYFLEARIGRDAPPAITHPEIYYGFVGVAIAFQVVFIIISRDVVRYRPFMIAAIIEKFSASIAAILLYLNGRVTRLLDISGFLFDLFLGALFVYAYVAVKETKK